MKDGGWGGGGGDGGGWWWGVDGGAGRRGLTAPEKSNASTHQMWVLKTH